jgi:hypothetical protein
MKYNKGIKLNGKDVTLDNITIEDIEQLFDFDKNVILNHRLKLGKEYIDTHFPENQKLFKKLQQVIKKNIKLTDPKNFKDNTKVITFFKLNSVEYVTKNASEIKKRIYLPKNKNKSVARFFKKEKQKNKIEEKLKILNKELKKTGMS